MIEPLEDPTGIPLEYAGGEAVETVPNDQTISLHMPTSQELGNLIARITPENAHEPMFDNLVDHERW